MIAFNVSVERAKWLCPKVGLEEKSFFLSYVLMQNACIFAFPLIDKTWSWAGVGGSSAFVPPLRH